MGTKKHHSEPRTKAIDIIQLFLGCRRTGAAEHGQDSSDPDHGHGSGAAEHVVEEKLTAWMNAHRKASLQDTATKQYDSAVESAKQFGCAELPEVCAAEEKTQQTRWRRR